MFVFRCATAVGCLLSVASAKVATCGAGYAADVSSLLQGRVSSASGPQEQENEDQGQDHQNSRRRSHHSRKKTKSSAMDRLDQEFEHLRDTFDERPVDAAAQEHAPPWMGLPFAATPPAEKPVELTGQTFEALGDRTGQGGSEGEVSPEKTPAMIDEATRAEEDAKADMDRLDQDFEHLKDTFDERPVAAAAQEATDYGLDEEDRGNARKKPAYTAQQLQAIEATKAALGRKQTEKEKEKQNKIEKEKQNRQLKEATEARQKARQKAVHEARQKAKQDAQIKHQAAKAPKGSQLNKKKDEAEAKKKNDDSKKLHDTAEKAKPKIQNKAAEEKNKINASNGKASKK